MAPGLNLEVDASKGAPSDAGGAAEGALSEEQKQKQRHLSLNINLNVPMGGPTDVGLAEEEGKPPVALEDASVRREEAHPRKLVANEPLPPPSSSEAEVKQEAQAVVSTQAISAALALPRPASSSLLEALQPNRGTQRLEQGQSSEG